MASLNSLLVDINGSAHRGVAEALGSLPIRVKGHVYHDRTDSGSPAVTWVKLLSRNRLEVTAAPGYIGRSLVVETADTDRLLVLKLAKKDDTAAGLEKEIRWMETLKESRYTVDCRFHIPSPLYVNNHRVFSIDQLPLPPPACVNLHPDRLAIAFDEVATLVLDQEIVVRKLKLVGMDQVEDGDGLDEVFANWQRLMMGLRGDAAVIGAAPSSSIRNWPRASSCGRGGTS